MKKHYSNCPIKLKKIVTISLTASALMITSNLFAQTTAPTNPAVDTQLTKNIVSELGNTIGAQFINLQTEISDLFYAGFQFINQQNYQTDPDLSTIKQVNTAAQNVTVGNTTSYDYQNAGPNQMSAAYAQQDTQNNIDDTLKQYIFAMQPSPQTTLTDANNHNFHDYMKQNDVKVLSGVQSTQLSGAKGVIYPADDNFYVTQNDYNDAIGNSNFERNAQKMKAYILKPTSPQNAIFNFGSLITPTSYDQTSAQAAIAKDFIKYVTQNTMSLFTDSDDPTQTIFQALSATQSSKPVVNAAIRADAIYQLSQNPVYQNFKYNLRTFLALRSIAVTMMNQLASERTAVSGLGTKAGLKDSKGNTIPNASPLQVESYIANHRLQDSNWYNNIENASPATLQRKTLVVLTEIEHQNYEAHLDRERLLAAITALNIMMNDQNMQEFLQKTSKDVKTAVQSAITKATNEIDPNKGNTAPTTTATDTNYSTNNSNIPSIDTNTKNK